MSNGLLSIKQLQELLEREAMARIPGMPARMPQSKRQSLEQQLFYQDAQSSAAGAEQLAEAFASQLHPRLDQHGYNNPQWKAAYNQFLANYRKQKVMQEQQKENVVTLGQLMDEEFSVEKHIARTNPQITDNSFSGISHSSVPASIREVYAVFVDDLGQPALKHIFNNESDANAYAKGLGFVKKLSVVTNLDDLSEMEKMDMRDRNR